MHKWAERTRTRLISTESETKRQTSGFHTLVSDTWSQTTCWLTAKGPSGAEPNKRQDGDLYETDIGAWECDSSC